MKKVLIGCGALFVILVVLAGIGGLLTYKTAQQVTGEARASEAKLQDTNRDFPFKAPEDGKLTEKQLTAWLNARRQTAEANQRRFGELRQSRSPLAGLRAIKMMPAVMEEFARTLRAEKLSLAEYGWITDQIMGALKSRPAAKDPKLAALAALAERPDPALQPQGRRGGMRFRGERPQYAPLGPDEARPILDLIEKHEAEFRKVAGQNFSDMVLRGFGRGRRLPAPRPAAGDSATTR